MRKEFLVLNGINKFPILGHSMSMTIVINSIETLERAADFYHDAIFASKQITFDKKNKIFSLKMIRDIMEDAVIIEKKTFFRKKWSVPRMKSILTFYHVNKIDLNSREPDDIISNIRYDEDKHRIKISCVKNTTIYLTVQKLDGKLEDIGEKFFDDTEYYTGIFGIETVKNRCVKNDY